MPSHHTDDGTMAMSTTIRTVSSSADHDPVAQLERAGDLAGQHGDQEDHEQQADRQQPGVLELVGPVHPAGDQREQALPGGLPPSRRR